MKSTLLLLNFLLLSLCALFAQDGALDLTFNSTGKVTTSLGSAYDFGKSLAIQSDGKIVVAGNSDNGTNYDFAVTRYHDNGSIDTGFGSAGKVTTAIGSFIDNANSVAIQSDGKIVVAGVTSNGISNDVAVVRYNTDGTLDTGFGTGGKVVTAINTNDDDTAFGVAIQSDGKIIIAGSARLNGSLGGDYDFLLIRYNTNGTLDTGFDTDGIVTTDFSSAKDQGYSIVFQSDGKIVVAGFSGINRDFAVARYNSNGTLDNTFDSDGKVTTAIGSSADVGHSVAIQSDGKIVVAGYARIGSTDDFAVVRYNSDGTLDTGFDTDGKVTTAIGTSTDRAYGIALQPDGKILVAGSASIGFSTIAVVRYNNNGSLDNTFDTDGIVITAVGSDGSDGTSIALQSDGKIVVAGDSYIGANDADFAVVRYSNSVTPVSSICGMKFNDLNGNGINDGEPGLSGWTINLTFDQATGPVTVTTTTGTDGQYCFDNLRPGVPYTVSETPQEGWKQMYPASPGSYSITLTSGQNSTGNDFGNQLSDTTPDPCIYLYNTDFEDPVVGPSVPGYYTQGYIQTHEVNVPFWQTTASDGKIEIWDGRPTAMDVAAYSGNQFAELNCTQLGTLYQTFTSIANQQVVISFAHRGRYTGLDKMELRIGPAAGPTFPLIGTYYGNSSGGWTLYSVPYTLPTSGLYQIRFESIYSNGGNVTIPGGNFLDAITIECPKPDDAMVTPGGPDNLCQSDTPSAITLSGASVGGSATTGAWSIVLGGGTLSSTAQTASPSTVTYTPVANYTGTVILKLTTNSSPAIGATRTITINALPTAPAAITGSFTTCVGSATQLADATAGGTWTSASTGIATVDASTGLVTGVSAGTSLISYTTGSMASICTNSVTQTVTVNASPTIIGTTPGSRCGTGTVILGAIASSGTTNWYDAITGGNLLGTGNSFTTPGISTTTTYYVNATSDGCTSATRTPVVATVNAIPIVSAPVSVSAGSTVSLSPNTGGNWISTNPLVATVSPSGLVTGVSAGTVTFTFTNTVTGCNATTELVTVTSKLSACDLLSATATKVTPGDCLWSLSLNQPTNLTGISSIQVLSLSPNQLTLGTALVSPYNTWFSSGSLVTGLTFTPSTGTVPGGNLTNFLTLNLSYVTSPQTVIVNWLNDLGGAVCSDTLELNCQPTCVSVIANRVTCVGNKYNLAYFYTNYATYGIHTIDYTVQSPSNVTISPASVILSPDVASNSTSGLQNILLSGALPGDQVSITAKFMSADGCCWCFETLNVTIPSCGSVCDSLSVSAQGTPEDCCYSISLTNTSSTVFSNIEFELLSGGIFGTMSTSSAGWGFTNIAPNNLLNLVKLPVSQGIGTGPFNNVLDLCIRQYSSANQVIEVRWMDRGKVVCRDTLRFECIKFPPVTDDCAQITNGILTCLPNGTFQYDFRVQNNSNINSTGFKINPTTPGVIFSQTDFPNAPILSGTLSPVQSIIVSGIGQGQNVCFQLTIFKTMAGAGDLVYSDCCHSEPVCIKTPECDVKLGSICGMKFNDLNGNGVKDSRGYGEPILPNWTINLSGPVTLSTITDVHGNYCFHDLPAGTYTVSEGMQPGWEQTLPQTPGTYTLTISAGQVLPNINFGNTYDPCLLGLKTWSALQTGIDGSVYALAVIGTDVYVAGTFTSIGGLVVNNIAKWNGQN